MAIGDLQIISAKQASSLLDVSQATVRNWVKHGYLSPVENATSKFRINDVILLKNRIAKGEIDRLRKRANKKKADNTFIPDEYLYDSSFVDEIKKIRDIFSSNKLNLEQSVLVLALKQLVLLGEVTLNAPTKIFDFSAFTNWRRDCVKNEIYSWMNNVNIVDKTVLNSYLALFQALTNVFHDDTVGIIYQSLMLEGSKSQKGSYYTPKELVEEIFENYDRRDGKFLDPCCGTGQFLICAAHSGFKDPLALYGFDIDAIAIIIARLNILLAFPEKDFTPNIYRADTLKDVANGLLFCNTNNLIKSFDLIATNPPWGASYKKEEVRDLNSLFTGIHSGESYSYFLAKSLSLLKEGGHISFILPESILNIRAHHDIRNHILANTTIEKIICYGRKFKGVFTPVIRIDLLKSDPDDMWYVKVKTNEGKMYKIPQSRFSKNEHNIFDVYLTNEESQIIEHLYSLPNTTLRNSSKWALGIVTGNNKKYLSDEKLRAMEPIYRGSDVGKYILKDPSNFIDFQPELFQQVAPEYLYRAKEKLVYKFISKKLVFAYDNHQFLTLNSANILIPEVNDYPIKLLLGLLNSRIYQFLFAKKFNTHKVLRGDLEKLPLPLLSAEIKDSIINLVDKAIDGQDVQAELDNLIMEATELSKGQIDVIMNWA